MARPGEECKKAGSAGTMLVGFTTPQGVIMNRREQTSLADIAVGLLAGLVATQVTNLVQGPLRRLTPRRVTLWERLVRPGASSSLVAARKVADHLDSSLSKQETERLGKLIHNGIGMAWGPVYGLLRRHGSMPPFAAGLATGTAMSLVLDEVVVPALGLSAPDQDYPILTHVRGFVAHLVYGAVAALTTEAVHRLTNTLPNRALGALRTGRS